MRATHINRQAVVILLVVVVAGFLIGSISLVYPFGRDQGIYAYVGKLILNGKIDYKYSYNLRPPAIHYTYALGQLVFGESMLGMRIFDLCWQIATAFTLFYLALRLTNRKSLSLVSAILYIFLYYRFDYWHTLQTDGFMNLPLSLTVLLLMAGRGKQSLRYFFIGGCIFALTVLFKFTILIFFFFLITLLLASKEFRKLISFSAGFVAILLLVSLYYVLNAAFPQFYEIQFIQIPLYARNAFETEPVGYVLSNIFRLFTTSVYAPLIFFSLLAYIYIFTKREGNFEKYLILCWALASILSLIIQWKFYLYHFVIIIPPLLVGTSLCFSLAFDNVRGGVIKFASAGALVIYLIFAGNLYYNSYGDLFSLVNGNSSLKDLYIQKGTTTDSVFTMNKIYQATDAVTENTKPGDKIYVWGIEPLIYYLSGRDCVSRFTYNTPLYWKDGSDDYRKEFLSELASTKPALILVAKRDPMYYITGVRKTSEEMLASFPELEAMLKEKYQYIDDVAEFSFYKHAESN